MTTHRHCCCEDPLAGHYGIVVIKRNHTEDPVYDLRIKNPTTHYHAVFGRGDYILPQGVTLFSEALKIPGITIITPNTNDPLVLRTKWLDYSKIRPKWTAPNYLGTSDEDVPMFTDPPTRLTWGTPNGDAVTDYTLSFFLPEQYKDYEMTEIESHHNFLTNLGLNTEICDDCGALQGAKFKTTKRYGIYSDLYTLFYNYIPIDILYGASLRSYFLQNIFLSEDDNWPKVKTYISDVLLPDDCCSPTSGCIPTYIPGNVSCDKSLNVDTRTYFTSGAKELDRRIRVQGGVSDVTFWQHIDRTYVSSFISLSGGINLYSIPNLYYFQALKCGIPTVEHSILLGETYCFPECGGARRSATHALFDIGAVRYFKQTLGAYFLWEYGKAPEDRVHLVRFCPVEYESDGETKKKIIITDVLDAIGCNTFHQNIRDKPIPEEPPFSGQSWPSYIQPIGVTLEILRVEPNSIGTRTTPENPEPCYAKEYAYTLCYIKRKETYTNNYGPVCGAPNVPQVCETTIYEESRYVKGQPGGNCEDAVADWNTYYASRAYSLSNCCNACEDVARSCGEDCFRDIPCGGCYTQTFAGGAELLNQFDVFYEIPYGGFGNIVECSNATGLLGEKLECDSQVIYDTTAVYAPYPGCVGGCGEVTYPNLDYSTSLARLFELNTIVVSDLPIEANPAQTYASASGNTITFSNVGSTGSFFDDLFKRYAKAYKEFYSKQFQTSVNIKKYLLAYEQEEYDGPTTRKRWINILDQKRYAIVYEVKPGPDGTIPGGNAEFIIEYKPRRETYNNAVLERNHKQELYSAGHIGSFVKNVYRCSKDLNSCGVTIFGELCPEPECENGIRRKYQNLCKSVIGHYGITWPKGLTGETAEREKILNLTDIFPTQPLFQSNITRDVVSNWCIPNTIKDVDVLSRLSNKSNTPEVANLLTTQSSVDKSVYDTAVFQFANTSAYKPTSAQYYPKNSIDRSLGVDFSGIKANDTITFEKGDGPYNLKCFGAGQVKTVNPICGSPHYGQSIIPDILLNQKGITQVSAGGNVTAVLDTDGKIWAWGQDIGLENAPGINFGYGPDVYFSVEAGFTTLNTTKNKIVAAKGNQLYCFGDGCVDPSPRSLKQNIKKIAFLKGDSYGGVVLYEDNSIELFGGLTPTIGVTGFYLVGTQPGIPYQGTKFTDITCTEDACFGLITYDINTECYIPELSWVNPNLNSYWKITAPSPVEYNGFIVEFNFENKKCGYTPNALNHHISLQIDGRLIETNGVVDRNLYTVKDYENHIYIRNPNHWLTSVKNEKLGITGVDITAISPWNSTVPVGTGQDKWGFFNAATAITPRHIITSAHYMSGEGALGQNYPGIDLALTGFTVGDTVKFVTNDNQVITRTIIGKINNSAETVYTVTNNPNYIGLFANSDIEIAVLDEDLPPSIKPVKLFDRNVLYNYIHGGSAWGRSINYTDYRVHQSIVIPPTERILPNFYNNSNMYLPAFWVDQKEESIINQLVNFTISDTNGYYPNPDENPELYTPIRFVSFMGWDVGHPYIPTVNNLRYGYGKVPIRGDSSSPVFLIINNELVLITQWTRYDSGDDLAFFKELINEYIEELGGDHQVSYYDLSQFTKNGMNIAPSVYNDGIDLKLTKKIEGGNNHLLVMSEAFTGIGAPTTPPGAPVRCDIRRVDPSAKRIKGFGNNSKGQLNFPQIPQTGNTYISMSAGKHHTAITNVKGNVNMYGHIHTNSGVCNDPIIYRIPTNVYGSYGSKIASGENHVVALETGNNTKYTGTIVKLDSLNKRIYVKGITNPPVYIQEPAGTRVVITNPSNKRSIQHQLRSIDLYKNRPEVIIAADISTAASEGDRTAIE